MEPESFHPVSEIHNLIASVGKEYKHTKQTERKWPTSFVCKLNVQVRGKGQWRPSATHCQKNNEM